MNRHLPVVAAALALLASARPAEAQSNPNAAAPNVMTLTAPPGPRQNVRLGFGYTMNPGPHNEYTYSYVVQVEPGSAAAHAGLAVGDTILSSDGNDARSGAFFPAARAGKRYVLRVRRNGEERELTYVYPAPPAAARPAPSTPPE